VGKKTNPSMVRHMLISRSAPHPAIAKTPTGGTILHQLRVE
jgi:hypothetical protein